mgnify:CR=1 FL=1
MTMTLTKMLQLAQEVRDLRARGSKTFELCEDLFYRVRLDHLANPQGPPRQPPEPQELQARFGALDLEASEKELLLLESLLPSPEPQQLPPHHIQQQEVAARREPGRAIVAGAGTLEGNTGRRRRTRAREDLARTFAHEQQQWQALQRKRRRLDVCADTVHGDINRDCGFTLSDLDFIKRYMAGDPPSVPNAAQLSTMDIDYDDDIDANDVTFILLALAKKYRFLAPAGASGALLGVDGCTVTAVIRDDANAPVANAAKTKVRLEVGTEAGNAGSETLMMTGPTAEGVFTATITAGATRSFVIMVETYTDDGATETQRKFAWYGTDHGSYGVAGMVWAPLVTQAVSCDGGASQPDDKVDDEPAWYWLVVSNSKSQKDKTGGRANKYPECTRSDARNSVARNRHGNGIGVSCCNAASGAVTRPDCLKNVPYSGAKAHCESKGLSLCDTAALWGKGRPKGNPCGPS